MNQKEQQQLRRLEIENEELREMNSRHIKVYGDQAWELVQLRSKLRMVEEAMSEPIEGRGDPE